MDELLHTVLQTAEIIIIKRDFDALRKIVLSLTSDVQTQMVPFTALFCYEGITYLKGYDPSLEIESTSKYSIKDIRQKAKFFDLRINSLIQSINNVDTMQNEYYIQQMKCAQFGHMNLHTNLGIYYDHEKHIVGNTHFEYYIFQDENTIKKQQVVRTRLELEGKEIQAFGYDMGCIISSISSAFSKTSDFMDSDFMKIETPFLSQDFNTNRVITDGNEKYKTIRLFLLHVLSSIGFILYCLKPRMIRDTGLLLRLEYITYHYALKRLDEVRNYCKNHKEEIHDPNLMETLESIDCSNGNKLRKQSFRNCMMHFGLKGKDDTPLISIEEFDLARPFCGLIETQFSISYIDYKSKIEKELSILYDSIDEYLGFNLLLKE